MIQLSIVDSRTRHRITSRFFNIPFIVFTLIVLVFSNFFIVPDSNWFPTLVITVFIFVINFSLGYYTVRGLLLKKNFPKYRYLVPFLFFLSYGLVPLLAAYLVIIFNDWWQYTNSTFFEFFSTVFGINLFVNTLLLIIYYTNSSIVVFRDAETTLGSENSVTKENIKKIDQEPDENIAAPRKSPDLREYILLKSNRVLSRIRFDEIVYLEVEINTVLIQTVRRFYQTRSTLGEILQGLPSNFVQISKNIVINLDYFEQLIFDSENKRSKAKIVYSGDGEDVEESFYIGRKFLPSLKEKLAK